MIILIKKKSHERSSMKIAQLSSKYRTRTPHSSSVTFRGAQKISHVRFLLKILLSMAMTEGIGVRKRPRERRNEIGIHIH